MNHFKQTCREGKTLCSLLQHKEGATKVLTWNIYAKQFWSIKFSGCRPSYQQILVMEKRKTAEKELHKDWTDWEHEGRMKKCSHRRPKDKQLKRSENLLWRTNIADNKAILKFITQFTGNNFEIWGKHDRECADCAVHFSKEFLCLDF